MLIRLLKLNVKKSILQGCSGFLSLACRMSPFRPISDSCSISFFKLVNPKVLSGGMKQSLFGGYGDVSSIRQYYKLLVKNLPLDVTKELVHKHFSQCGKVLLVNKSGVAKYTDTEKHFAVAFADKDGLDIALKSQPHLINRKRPNLSAVHNIDFLVTWLAEHSTELSLKNYFSRFGTVMRCELRRNVVKKTNFCFVNFAEHNQKNEGLASNMHVVDLEMVRVERIFPEELSIYVGNLSPLTTDQSLKNSYSQFGTIKRAEVKRDRWTGQSRGFGFVTFSSQQELQSAISSYRIIDGKEVRTDYETMKFTLFVSRLHTNTTETDLRIYYERFGPVYSCRIPRDNITKLLQPFGWVTFSSLNVLNDALAARPHEVNGKKINADDIAKKARQLDTMIVKGLSPRTTDKMLYDVFSKFGSVVSSVVELDLMSAASIGTGYVRYSSPDEMRNALLGGPHEVDNMSLDVMPSDKFNIQRIAASVGQGIKGRGLPKRYAY